MKAKHVILYFLVSIIISSCIRDEALNAEADILSCTLPKAVMTTSPIINNNSVTLFVGPETDVSNPCTGIHPDSGTYHQPFERNGTQILIYRKNTLSQQPTESGKRHIQFRLLIRNLQLTTTSRTLSVGKNTIYS